jgi:hypothetical protein
MAFDIGGAIRGALEGDIPEDGPPLDVTAGGKSPAGESDKIPLEKASNLIRVRQAHEQFANGEISAQQLTESVGKVLQTVGELLGLFDLPIAQKQLADAGETAQQVAEKARQDLESIAEGLEQMIDAAESGDRPALDAGMAAVQAGYQALDSTQDTANELLEE